MNLTLERTQFRKDGIFGQLRDEQDLLVAVTLEHAYAEAGLFTWTAKIPEGEFKCVRGEHYLHGMTEPFETFEVYGVDGHAGLLFHWGNFNKDSEGCILLGEAVRVVLGAEMIINSRDAFQKFMELQKGVDTFTLNVRAAVPALTAA